ncbi:hypothetical protein BG006_009248 [Podila minutissima]|uniref:Uncharacterized protein n=1 Tax=Podila minutissima TaxID=64525 RepID=A0A9P5VJH8_9FUNG|nr:hypothetical protein BG006_009248 [Podila minutissima]
MSSNEDETAPLLDNQNGATPKQGQEKKYRILLVVAHVLGFLVLVAFASGYYLGNRVWPFKSEAPYPDPPKPLPVCNLDHIEGYTETVPIALENNFQIFNVVFDEGIVGNILVNVHEDSNRTDIVLKQTIKFSDPSIESYFDALINVSFRAYNRLYSQRFFLNLPLDQRQSLLYNRHHCAGVDLEITFPQKYLVLDQLNIHNRYKGNIDVRTDGFVRFNLLTAKTAHGDIRMNLANAMEMTLNAPAGAIDAVLNVDNQLVTYSSEDTTIDFFTWPYFADMNIVSEKRTTVKYPYKGKFLMQSATRPLVTGYQDTVVNITKEDEHLLEGKLGADWALPWALPRLVLKGHDTVLELKSPYVGDELRQEQEWRDLSGFNMTMSRNH